MKPRSLTPSERASMERATAEAHAAFDQLLRDRASRMRIDTCKRFDLEGHPTEIRVVKTDSNGTGWAEYILVPPGEDITDALVDFFRKRAE